MCSAPVQIVYLCLQYGFLLSQNQPIPKCTKHKRSIVKIQTSKHTNTYIHKQWSPQYNGEEKTIPIRHPMFLGCVDVRMS